MDASRAEQSGRTEGVGLGAGGERSTPVDARLASGRSGPPGTPASDPNRTAAEICRDVRLGMRARKLLTPELKPGQYLILLVERRLYADAVRYMAHALLNREAVWWACLCARAEVEALEGLSASDQRALGSAVLWVLEPSEANRQAASRSSSAVGRLTPAGAVARAASFALGQSDQPAPGSLPPLPAQAARLAACGVLLAASRGESASASVRLRQFITLGLDVAYGHNRWD